jgi:hypothetical protein
MKSSSDLHWEFGAIPMIEPEYLGGILATSSDIALLIDQNATVHSILLNSSEKNVWQPHSLGRVQFQKLPDSRE